MPKITRQTHKVFGAAGSSDNFAQFGSLVAADPIKTKDLATIMGLPAWDNGFQDSVYGANKDLLLEDLNGFALEHSTQIAYILQAGIPEWDAGTTYFKGSYVQRTDVLGNATGEQYVSLVDNNVGNALPVQATNANWQYLGGNATAPGIGADYFGVIIPSGWVWQDGSTPSRASLPNLFRALNITLAGNLSVGLATITGLPSTTNLKQGFFIGGVGIPNGATIASIDSGSQVTMSLPALSTQTPSSIDFGPWGVGDGSTTFTLPDSRRRVGVGAGGASNGVLGNILGNVGGEDAHTLTIAEMPPHNHPVPFSPASPVTPGGTGNYTSPTPSTTGSAGGGAAHNNIQQSYVCTKIIKT